MTLFSSQIANMNRNEEEEIIDSLSAEFQKVLDFNEELSNSPLSSNDPEYQKMVSHGIDKLENLTKNINHLGVFSVNESVEEISTENLKYLLLPALLANFTLRNQQNDRVEVLNIAEIYYKDFITRLNDYKICDVNLKQGQDEEEDRKQNSKTKFDPLIKSAQLRSSKITLFREMKELDEQLSALKTIILEKKNKGLIIDDEVERKFYLKLIHRWLNMSIEELSSIEMEKPMAKMRISMMSSNNTSSGNKYNLKKTKALKPIIITRDQVQKKVYGLGYPSIPTVTVDEFVSQKINDGTLAFNNKNVYSNSLYNWASNPEQKKMQDLNEEEIKELKLEKDDPNELTRMRKMDDWKDVHKRGEGNRHNMG